MKTLKKVVLWLPVVGGIANVKTAHLKPEPWLLYQLTAASFLLIADAIYIVYLVEQLRK